MEKNRREFVKMAAAGAAGVVVGGAGSAKAATYDGPAPLDTPITDLLGVHASELIKDAKKLTKGDLVLLRKFHKGDETVTRLSPRLKKLDYNEIMSIEAAFDKKHSVENSGVASPPGDVTACCCCCPCCTCAAAVE